MAEKPIVQFFQSGATSLIKHFCEEINLVNRINRAVTWDPAQWKVSPGHHVLALVINTLCGRLPLSHVKEFFRKQDVEILFGEGIRPDDFNDDALGRTLDRLHEADPKSILSAITLESLMTADEPLLFAHADTTSKTLYGAYDYPETEGVVQIARGYNKDGQLDAKQIVIGMVTVRQGTPLFANVCNGNQDDPTWNADMVETIGESLEPDQLAKLVYVADSKFFSKENVQKAHRRGLKFISLVSEQHKLREEAINYVLERSAMTDIGSLSEKKDASTYRLQEVRRSFHGVDLRLAVVYSSHLFQQKQATYHRQLEKEKERLSKEIDQLMKQEFSCENDASQALEVWSRKQGRKSPFPMTCRVQTLIRPVKRQGRGRPKKTEEAKQETVYTLVVDLLAVPQEVIAEHERRLGYFVLATNANDPAILPTVDILREYKQQSTVELRFKFLKDPTFVDALYLKTPERIEALGYLLLLALFIYMTIERRLRLALEQKQIRLQPMKGQYTTKPTARQIFLMLSAITVMKWYDRDDQVWYREVQLEDEVRKVFELLEFDPDSYTKIAAPT
jgi:transposase